LTFEAIEWFGISLDVTDNLRRAARLFEGTAPVERL
jgi:hypothetical protein